MGTTRGHIGKLAGVGLTLIAVGVHQAVMAAGDQVPHQFQTGQKAVASDVNANFQELADRIETLRQDVGGAPVTSMKARDYLPSGNMEKLFTVSDVSTSPSATPFAPFTRDIKWQLTPQPDGTISLYREYPRLDPEPVAGMTYRYSQHGVLDAEGAKQTKSRSYTYYDWGYSDINSESVYTTPILKLKANMRKHDTWVSAYEYVSTGWGGPSSEAKQSSILRYTVLGQEDVTTPAGRFPAALKVMKESLSSSTSTPTLYWYAPGIGIVRESYGSAFSELSSYEFTSGAVINAGTYSLTAGANSLDGAKRVEIFENGSLLAALDSEPFFHPLALTAADNGDHTYVVKIYDGLGTLLREESRSLTVAISADQQAPVISLSADKTVVSDTAKVTFTAATSDIDVAYVDFLDDQGTLLYRDHAAPFNMAHAFTAFDDGTHSFTAKAVDLVGNEGDSNTFVVTVDIAADASGQGSIAMAKSTIQATRDWLNVFSDQGNPGAILSALGSQSDFAYQFSSYDANNIVDAIGKAAALLGDICYSEYASATGVVPSGQGYNYDMSPRGGVGTGTITKEVTAGQSLCTLNGIVNGVSLQNLVFSLPAKGTTLQRVDGSLTLQQAATGNSNAVVSLPAGRLQLVLDQATELSGNGVGQLPPESAGWLIREIVLNLTAIWSLKTAGGETLTYQGEMDFAAIEQATKECSTYSYWDSYMNMMQSYESCMFNASDIIPTRVNLAGTVTNSVAESSDLSIGLAFVNAGTFLQQLPESENNFQHVKLSMQGTVKVPGMPDSLAEILLDRNMYEQGNLDLTLAYGDRALRFSGAVADDSGQGGMNILGDLVINDHNGVEITLSNFGAQEDQPLAGTVIANGVQVGSVSEARGYTTIEYTDGSFESF
ncbi:MAG: Ig-like domain-containing protein [Sedimenticola sp.]